ncbi:unnamed protein product [Toxocara canis]|uniref:Uncharacterized protein n=1 Tax=Toxocara canis TaxID=6265 RepID=A0A3P7F082_TOXCA|nr:unnamed protein product [Toxocara canis]
MEWTAGIDDAECGELVCGICAAKVNFLRYYTDKHYEEMQEDAVCKLKALMRKCVLIEEGDVGDAQVDDKMCKEKREQLNDQQVHSEREHDSSISPEEAHQACTTGATEGTNKQTVLECYTQKEKDGSAEEEQDVKQRLVGLSHEHVQRSDEVRIDKTNILEEGQKETVDFAETNEMRKRGSESSGDFDGTHRERETNAEPASSKECPDEESSKADGNVGSARREESLQKTVQGLEKLKVLLFRSSTWRQRLCKCKECWSMYEEKGVAFLLDPDDTLDSYTKDRYSNRPSEEVENKRVIDSLINLAGRDGAIFLMQGYEKMKNKILEMLMKKSAENSTITKEDVAKAFRELREETKRPRLE